jgi:hypothetical protein
MRRRDHKPDLRFWKREIFFGRGLDKREGREMPMV